MDICMNSLKSDFRDKNPFSVVPIKPTFWLISTAMGAFSFAELNIVQISTIVTHAGSFVVMNVEVFGARAEITSWKILMFQKAQEPRSECDTNLLGSYMYASRTWRLMHFRLHPHRHTRRIR